MEYESINQLDMRQAVESSIRELEGQHFSMCIQIAANRNIPGTDIKELEKRKVAIEQGIRNLKREYADLLAIQEAASDG